MNNKLTLLTTKMVRSYSNSYNYPDQSKRTGLAQWIAEIQSVKNNWLVSHRSDDLLFLKILCIKGGHQNRMKWIYVVFTIRALDNCNLFDFTRKHKNFCELYQQVTYAVKNIPFAQGLLTRYDISLHIAVLLDSPVYPDHVFLSEHTSKSAQALGISAFPYADRSEFSSIFDGLTCMQIEDILCVYSKIILGDDNNIDEITQRSCCCKKKDRDKLITLYRKAESAFIKVRKS